MWPARRECPENLLLFLEPGAGTTIERLQHLLTDADWDPVALDQGRVWQMVAASPAGGMLAIGDTTFPKKGKHSVGVTHQYCGELGKRANCQAFVTAEIQKQSKIEIALELIDRATLWNVPFRLVTADAAYGQYRDFLEGLEERKLLYACAAGVQLRCASPR